MKINPIKPGPGQESVWDYPRPPRVEASDRHIQVMFNGMIIAETNRSRRVLETSHPPVFYIPPEDIQLQYLVKALNTSFCEWKSRASYYHVAVKDRQVENAAWYYPDPTPAFTAITGFIAFYPGLMDACFVDGELVQPQPGGFYGGWITREIVGPFKGEPGTMGW